MKKLILMLSSLLLLPAASAAQVLDAPFYAAADGGGAFSYTVEMTYPASGAYFGGYTILSIANITGAGQYIDGFCMSWVSGNTVTTYEVTGTLADPGANGTLSFEWFGCDPGFSLTAQTLILAPEVADEAPTWSALKQRYR